MNERELRDAILVGMVACLWLGLWVQVLGDFLRRGFRKLS